MSTPKGAPELTRDEVEQLLGGRSPAVVGAAMQLFNLALKGYFRAEMRGMDRLPDGGALVVSNHSGGLTPMDLPILMTGVAREFGSERAVYCLAHDTFMRFLGPLLRPLGLVAANRENAHAILTSGAVTIVFPGGDYDALRPTWEANKISFNGRTGYVRTALAAGVPLVPMVSIGGQEDQLHLSRGQWIGRHLPTRHFFRSEYFPISFGFPFGLTAIVPLSIPLPTKIVTQMLDPIDIEAEFGPDPDIAEVDAEVRRRMQETLDELASQRRFPVLG